MELRGEVQSINGEQNEGRSISSFTAQRRRENDLSGKAKMPFYHKQMSGVYLKT